MKALALAALAGLACTALPASAEVVQSSDTGFTVSHKVSIAAPPERAWAALIQPALWWQSDHSYSGDARNLSLDARPGGCWCEKLANGGVEHMRVVYLAAPTTLRLVGGLGPLQAMPVTGVLTIELKPQGTGTEAILTYAVAGSGLAPLAAPVDGVLGIQWARLKAAAEKR